MWMIDHVVGCYGEQLLFRAEAPCASHERQVGCFRGGGIYERVADI